MIRIVTAHDSTRHYAEMADVAKVCAKRVGYDLEIKETINVKHSKASILKNALTKEWVVWMDSDSMLMNNIDEVFETDADVVLVVQEPLFWETGARHQSKRFGFYLFSGFVAVRNTKQGKQFLDNWGSCPQTQTSDQRNLHDMFEGHIDDSIYDKAGETITVNGLKIHLLDPDIYVHRQAIHDMEPPVAHIKIIHFVGRLHRKWPEYKGLLC